jgi:L-amino acid N-acyltransferase YncA
MIFKIANLRTSARSIEKEDVTTMDDDPIADCLFRAYPKTVKLNDGSTLTIRSLIPQDRAEIGTFFEEVPEDDRAFLKEDLLNREEIEIWLDEIDTDRETTMVALADNRIVGSAILERQRHGWSRHVGEIRIVAHPAYRRRGLGHLLAQTVFELAQKAGLEKLLAQMVADQPGAIRVFKRLGFRTEATLNDQVKDRHGRKHDLLVMAHYMESSPS